MCVCACVLVLVWFWCWLAWFGFGKSSCGSFVFFNSPLTSGVGLVWVLVLMKVGVPHDQRVCGFASVSAHVLICIVCVQQPLQRLVD